MKPSVWLFGYLSAIRNSLVKQQFQVCRLHSADINCYKIHTGEKNIVNIKAGSSSTYIGQLREIDNENQWPPVLCMEVKVLTNYSYFTQCLVNA